MAQDIIQHHEPFDFESFFESIKSQYIGLDYHDFSNFLHTVGVKHSFMGSADGKNRVKTALENIMVSDEAVEIINHASSVMLTLIRSSETSGQITMDEVGYLNEFISGLPNNCDVVWGIAEDDSLGDTIKTIILVNTNNRDYGIQC